MMAGIRRGRILGRQGSRLEEGKRFMTERWFLILELGVGLHGIWMSLDWRLRIKEQGLLIRKM